MAFKMRGFTPFTSSQDKSKLIKATEGKYKGQMVDNRTGLPPGITNKNEAEISNADEIAILRAKMETVEPFSEEEEAIRQQIIQLRKQ